MIHKFFQDDGLRLTLKSIINGSRIIHKSYANMVGKMSEGPDAALEFAARRANEEFIAEDIIPTLLSFYSNETAEYLEFTPKNTRTVDPYTCTEPWFLEEVRRAESYKTFVVTLSGNHGWAKLQFSRNLPGKLASVHHPNPAVASTGCKYMELLTNSISKAESTIITAAPGTHGTLKKFIERIGFVGEQFPREIMVTGNNESWRKDSQELLSMSTACYRGSLTTASVMEKCFAHLAQCLHQSNTNLKLAFESKWLYTICNSQLPSSGLKQIMLTKDDFLLPGSKHQEFRERLDFSRWMDKSLVTRTSEFSNSAY